MTWEAKPDPIGHLGSDAGQDIRAVELSGGPKRTTRRTWLVQVKRYKEIHPQDLRDIVEAAIPVGSKAPHAFVVAVACDASRRCFDALDAAAKARGVKRIELWSREKVNDFLNEPKNALTSTYYFGDGSAIPGTVPLPVALDRSIGRDAPLLGRIPEVAELLAAPGDVVIVGPAGTGKSRLAAEIPGRRFLTTHSTADAVAASIRNDQPTHVVIDDAGLDVARLGMLLELRQQSYAFRIVATTWVERLDDVRALLPNATRIEIAELERPAMDETLKAIGVGHYYLRSWILDLAEGRPGWAISLTQLAKEGRINDVRSGRGLIESIGPYLNRVNPSAGPRALALLGVLAAVGPVAEEELPALDSVLGTSPVDRHSLLREAAAVGMIELRGTSLTVVPEALRPALLAHLFFEGTARLRLGDVLAAFPNRGHVILERVIDAAHAGSTAARAEVERRLPDLTPLFGWGGYATLVSYATLDKAAAQRALSATSVLDPGDEARRRIVRATGERFLLPDAIGAMLSSAIGDERAEHSTPEHPVRLLGEMGRRVDPLNQTSFELRAPILTAANQWLDDDPSSVRQEIWARVVAQLLDPHVEGAFPDSGSPMTIHLPAGAESEEHIIEIGATLWPEVRSRLVLLDTRALVLLVAGARELAEIARGYALRGDLKPTLGASAAAAGVLDAMLPELSACAPARPALQLTLHRLRKDMRVGPRQPLDPEFRLLSMGWETRSIGGDSKHLSHAVERLVDGWLAEPPAAVMRRVARWRNEAAITNRDLDPVGGLALRRYAERGGDVDATVSAAISAGLLGPAMYPLLRQGMAEGRGLPAWLDQVFAGPLRWLALSVAMDPGADRRIAERALTELKEEHAGIVEVSALRHSHHGGAASEDLLLALLTHPITRLRGVTAVEFPRDGPGSPSTRSPAFYAAWQQAFLEAPIENHHNWQLGQHLNALATADPKLVTAWLLRRAADDEAMWRLEFERKLDISTMPRPDKDELMQSLPEKHKGEVLGLLLGDDRDWASSLVDAGVCSIDDVWHAIARQNRDGVSAAEALAWAPTLRRHGAAEGEVLRLMDLGHVGPESGHYAKLKEALEAEPVPADAAAEAVRQAGIQGFADAERSALEREHRERVTGRIH